jgi:hypothetical protein
MLRFWHSDIQDPWWNPAVEEQAFMRIHRIGQKREVRVKSFIVKVRQVMASLSLLTGIMGRACLLSQDLKCLASAVFISGYCRGASGCNRSKCASRGWFLGRSLMRRFVALALSISRCCLNDCCHELPMCIADAMSLMLL